MPYIGWHERCCTYGEEHILRILVFDASGNFDVAVFLVVGGLFLYGCIWFRCGDARFAISVFTSRATCEGKPDRRTAGVYRTVRVPGIRPA